LYSVTPEVTEAEKEKLVANLKKRRYKITDEDGNILAEKNRFSRWGPYVNHIGLIIILLAALLRTTPLLFLDDNVWVGEGETKLIPSTDGEHYIEHTERQCGTHDPGDPEEAKVKESRESRGEMIHKNYQTDAVVYEAKEKQVAGQQPDLQEIKRGCSQM